MTKANAIKTKAEDSMYFGSPPHHPSGVKHLIVTSANTISIAYRKIRK